MSVASGSGGRFTYARAPRAAVKTPKGTSVGVDDPYAFVERCDHLTEDGRCRYAAEHGQHDPKFARERRADDLRCPAAEYEARRVSERRAGNEATREQGEWEWADCPHFRSRERDCECVRCGLEERRVPGEARPLLEEHHLSYRGEPEADMEHEITVYLCRWCHAKVHQSWARVDDDVGPDAEAIAAAEERRSRELEETAFSTAAERYDPDG
jgi:hypothetical protein